MLEMIRGCTVPKPELLSEQYEIGENTLTANVNANKIESVFQHFINMQKERLFFILELPTNENDERKLRADDTTPRHNDVYYVDGLDKEQALQILSHYGKLLINDGMSHFGFGILDMSAEIMLYKYNVMSLWTNVMEKYADFFEEHSVPRACHCFTAWETFSRETPGECRIIETDGVSAYDLPEILKDWGIYLAEQREED